MTDKYKYKYTDKWKLVFHLILKRHTHTHSLTLLLLEGIWRLQFVCTLVSDCPTPFPSLMSFLPKLYSRVDT